MRAGAGTQHGGEERRVPSQAHPLGPQPRRMEAGTCARVSVGTAAPVPSVGLMDPEGTPVCGTADMRHTHVTLLGYSSCAVHRLTPCLFLCIISSDGCKASLQGFGPLLISRLSQAQSSHSGRVRQEGYNSGHPVPELRQGWGQTSVQEVSQGSSWKRFKAVGHERALCPWLYGRTSRRASWPR